MRTYRHRSALLAAATTAALALALTACGGEGTGTQSAGPADTSSAPAAAAGSSQDAGTTKDTAKDTNAAETTGNGSGTADSNGGGAAASAPVCTTEDVAISAARQDGPPYTHLVLTAKNTSGHSCTIQGFPKIQFLESHKEDVPAIAKSKPAAPVVLEAGAPAYALVKLSDGGADEENEPVSAFALWLEGGDGMATVTAPGDGGIAVDPAVWATGYWTHELRNGADEF